MFFFGALERNITPCVSVSKFPLGCFLVLHEITSFKMVFDLLFATKMFFFFSGSPGTSFRVFIYIFRIVDNWFFKPMGIVTELIYRILKALREFSGVVLKGEWCHDWLTVIQVRTWGCLVPKKFLTERFVFGQEAILLVR